jgi:hypothetical protein
MGVHVDGADALAVDDDFAAPLSRGRLRRLRPGDAAEPAP